MDQAGRPLITSGTQFLQDGMPVMEQAQATNAQTAQPSSEVPPTSCRRLHESTGATTSNVKGPLAFVR